MFRHRPPSARWLKLVVGMGTLCALAGTYAGWQFFAPVARFSGQPRAVPFSVAAGQSVKQIGRSLEQAGLVRSRFWFETWVWLTDTERSFVTGEYRVPSRTNLPTLVTLLTSGGEPDNEVTLRFIEGWTIRDMAQYLRQAGSIDADEFTAYVTKRANVAAAVAAYAGDLAEGKPESASLEGYLFPDTYRTYRGSSASALVSKMFTNLNRKFLPEWRNEVHRRGYTTYQAIVMASIVEREVRSESDRALVADIFWRRLAAGRGLEADSTINYVTRKDLASVTLEDTKLDSPYNTYRYRGLPPGPISNPGESSIRAAVYPQPNNFWYFLTTPQGEVIYSKTFDEHRAAKFKYLR